MYKFDYNKALKRNQAKQAKQEAKTTAYYIKEGIEHTSRPFEWAMDWKPRLKIFKYKARSVCTFDPFKIEVVSYEHWVFVKVVKGKVIFNDYSYSVTTSSHQRMVRRLLEQLGIKIDVTVNCRSSLDSSLSGVLYPLYWSNETNRIAIASKGSRQKTNEWREQTIKDNQRQIKELKKLGARIHNTDLGLIAERARRNEAERIAALQRKLEARRNSVEYQNKVFNKSVNKEMDKH